MKAFALILSIAILTAGLSGCAAQADRNAPSSPPLPEAPQSAVQQSAPEPEPVPEPEPSHPNREDVSSPPAELKIPGEITVYCSYGESDIFEPYVTPFDKAGPTLLDIAAAVEKQLDVMIPIKEITQRKGMVVVDIDGSFIEGYPKATIYDILTAYGVTLRENHIGFEWIQYQLDGEIGVFGERYELPPLKLIEGTAAEFAAIRASVAYEGLQDYFWLEQPILDTDETGWELTRYLAMLRVFDKEFSSPAELENSDVLAAAIYATKHYTSDPIYSENYAPSLLPLVAPASEVVGFYEDWFWLKEHVEQSARLLFGDDYNVKHQDISKYRYIEALGVYTPPHMGGGFSVLPVILSYDQIENHEDYGDCYAIELTYLLVGEGGYLDPDVNWEVRNPISENVLKQYVTGFAKRRSVVVGRAEDGRFVIRSQKLNKYM